MADPFILIGQLAQRAGVAASALRFYETEGLLTSLRSGGDQRQYPRSALRRVAFIRAAQAVGLSLHEVRAALATLPEQRTPTQADWQRLSRQWQPLLDARIAALTQLRDQLSSCIGCGCLSLQRCKLYNPQDVAATRGPGPRFLMGDRSAEVRAQVQALALAQTPATATKPAARQKSRQTRQGRT
jgi:MerR family transcriptional regulator, redox-sensitive transcriptional activator SoxR